MSVKKPVDSHGHVKAADGPGNVKPADIPRREVYPSHEARVLLGDMSEMTFRRLTKSGRLKSKKIGSRVYVKHAMILDFIETCPDTESDAAWARPGAASTAA